MTTALVLFLLMIVLLGGTCWVSSLIVLNTPRYMAAAPSMLWRDAGYIRQLPNVLKRLYDAGFASPWPERPTALSAIVFRHRLCRVLRAGFPDFRRLAGQHLSLWAFVQLHDGDLRRLILQRQFQRARHILCESRDADVRMQIVEFLTQCKAAHERAARWDTAPASTVDAVGWLARIRSFDVLLREHGYRVSEHFATLDRWEEADDETILGELSPQVRQAAPA